MDDYIPIYDYKNGITYYSNGSGNIEKELEYNIFMDFVERTEKESKLIDKYSNERKKRLQELSKKLI